MSWLDALNMGKYAPYVWGSYGVVLLGLVAEVVWLRIQRRTILGRTSRIIRMTTRQDNETQA